MFLVTSITMLRERTSGMLERLMTLPLAKLDLLAGYGIAFGVLASLQAVVVSVVGFAFLQAVQFMPALISPQLLLCGLFVDRDAMAPLLDALSRALPLTYAYDALARVIDPAELGGALVADAIVVVGATLGALALGALTLRRRTP